MKFFTTVWLLLLGYVIAALLFWGLSLHRQSEQLYQKDRALLVKSTDSLRHPYAYAASLQRLETTRRARRHQYLGEGVTFMAIMLLGAAIVFTSFRRKIRLSRQQNNFMLAVTHELKSPLAAVKLNLQTLEKRSLEEPQKQKLLHSSITEADRLNDLCNKILVAAQMDGRQYRSLQEEVELSALALECTAHYQGRYPGHIEAAVLPGVAVSGDRLLLEMAINNLLENAIKYSGPDARIRLELSRHHGLALLCVTDNGPGIPDKHKAEIFKKFYRLGDEATRNTKGTGLGLFLTARIAKQHKGKVMVSNNMPKGSIFQLSLPALGVA